MGTRRCVARFFEKGGAIFAFPPLQWAMLSSSGVYAQMNGRILDLRLARTVCSNNDIVQYLGDYKLIL